MSVEIPGAIYPLLISGTPPAYADTDTPPSFVEVTWRLIALGYRHIVLVRPSVASCAL